MPVDTRELYKKLAELLGGTRGKVEESRGEYYDIPGYGAVRTTPVNPAGWNTREVWYKNDGNIGNEQPRYTEGQIPDWMKSGIDFISKGRGKLSEEEMKALARHWVYGEGVSEGYRAAFEAQPQWVTDWLKAQFAPELGTPMQ